MGNFSAALRIFSLAFLLYDFFRPVHEYFLGLLGMHEFFSFNFPLQEFFLVIRPLPPNKVSNCPSLNWLKEEN